MPEVSTYEAKTLLPKLLERVEQGERFVITRHGRPVAELVPVSRRDSEKICKAIADLRAFRKTHSLSGLSSHELIDEGHRY